VYRDGALKFLTAILAGTAIHAGFSLLERLIPGLGPGLDPFLRLVPALVASLMATSSTLFGAAVVGALVGGLVGLVGMSVAALIWLPGGHELPAIASVTGTSLLVGEVGGLLGYRIARVRKSRTIQPSPAGPGPGPGELERS
jgi:hypothetical protein